MKRTLILVVALYIIPFFGISQTIENLDFISPFEENLAAVKKGNQWGFINKEGALVINFRTDLVKTRIRNEEYPVFNNGRCIILKKQNDISYFGYIDTFGKTVIKPTFLNATNFHNNSAIVLKLNKEKAGYNNILGKDIVYYTYIEVIINANGEIKENLTAPINVILSKEKLKIPPKITSKFLSEKLISVKNKKGRWTIKKYKNE
jgi:hypothetical protein